MVGWLPVDWPSGGWLLPGGSPLLGPLPLPVSEGPSVLGGSVQSPVIVSVTLGEDLVAVPVIVSVAGDEVLGIGKVHDPGSSDG